MYYKEYGSTGMRVSAVGMGCMRYDDAAISAGRLGECAEVPAYAYERGVTYFDTAPDYCQDKSEEITGMGLSAFPRESYVLSSKVNLGTLNGVATAGEFRRRLELTLSRLRTDHLDVYHLWCMQTPAGFAQQCGALYRFFEDAKREGLIRHIATSVHMQGRDIEDVVATGKFEGLLLGYNALNYRFRQSGILAAHRAGMGVVIMNPLGGGLIPQNPGTFRYLCGDTDRTVAQAALRFVAAHEEVSVALNGFTTKAQVDDAVRAVEGLAEQPAAALVAELEARGGVVLNDLCTSCGYCNHCPKQIPIPQLMDAYNQKLLTGREQEIHDRLAYHWGLPMERAAECVACGKCEALCTQHLPIIRRLREIAALAGTFGQED